MLYFISSLNNLRSWELLLPPDPCLIFWMRKLKLRKLQHLAQGHPAMRAAEAGREPSNASALDHRAIPSCMPTAKCPAVTLPSRCRKEPGKFCGLTKAAPKKEEGPQVSH